MNTCCLYRLSNCYAPIVPQSPIKEGLEKKMLAEKKYTYTVVLVDISSNTLTGNIPRVLPKSVL